MTDFSQKHILLGLTGGVAAYKAAELTRLLTKVGHTVQVVMTEAACRFISPVTLQALSGRPVFTDLWDARVGNNMAHIDLARAADLILVAPASADFLAKLAHGLADDLLSTLCLARDCPLWVAPAMNRQMWEHPATQRNVQQLAQDGVQFLGPDRGVQACGETGLGRMLEPEQILAGLGATAPLLAGQHVLVTAGPTFEPVDAVRGITNASSGKMGYAIAQAALAAGAQVTLVSGPTHLAPPPQATVVPVRTAAEMMAAVLQTVEQADIFIAVAAVADYHVKNPSPQKIKKESTGPLTLVLEPNPDILATVAALPQPPFCVGFAAESERLEEYAEAKRKRKNLPLLAANLAQAAIGADENELILFDDAGRHPLPAGPKPQVARELIAYIAGVYPSWRATHRR
jgi:phosphopantothenoylcysteine decarboxylase / phosphopantothenate---cysteine ligase